MQAITSINTRTEYYPGGWKACPPSGVMTGRQTTGSEGYRYACLPNRQGYQGQFAESLSALWWKDHETGACQPLAGNQFEARMYDGRINRWMTTDPAGEFYSPYMAMRNNWMNGVDPDGALFFGLFGSSSAQRQAARADAAEFGGTVSNLLRRDIYSNISFEDEGVNNNYLTFYNNDGSISGNLIVQYSRLSNGLGVNSGGVDMTMYYTKGNLSYNEFRWVQNARGTWENENGEKILQGRHFDGGDKPFYIPKSILADALGVPGSDDYDYNIMFSDQPKQVSGYTESTATAIPNTWGKFETSLVAVENNQRIHLITINWGYKNNNAGLTQKLPFKIRRPSSFQRGLINF